MKNNYVHNGLICLRLLLFFSRCAMAKIELDLRMNSELLWISKIVVGDLSSGCPCPPPPDLGLGDCHLIVVIHVTFNTLLIFFYWLVHEFLHSASARLLKVIIFHLVYIRLPFVSATINVMAVLEFLWFSR